MGQSASSSTRRESGTGGNNEEHNSDEQPSSLRRIDSEALFRGTSASSLPAMAAAAEWESNTASASNNSFTTTAFGAHDSLRGVAARMPSSARDDMPYHDHHDDAPSSLPRYDTSRAEATDDPTTFVPTTSQHEHEWMGRSIETLILGHAVAPTRIIIDDDDMSSNSSHHYPSTRRSSLSTRGSLDFLLQRRSSLELGVREPRNVMMQGGSLAQYYYSRNSRGSNAPRQRRRSSLSSCSSHHSFHNSSNHNSSSQKGGPNICLSLLAREVTGRNRGFSSSLNKEQPAAERLRQMGGKALHQNLDRPAGGILLEIEQLEAALNRGDWNETTNLVSRLTPRLMGDPMRHHHHHANGNAATIDDPTLPSFAPRYYAGGGRLGLERDAFVLGGGVQVLMRVFFVPAFIANSPTIDMSKQDSRCLPTSMVSNKLASCWNEVLASLRELVYAMPILVQNGTILEEGKFLPFLFTLLSHDSLFDAAATLIEEILCLLSHSPPPPVSPDEAPIDGEYRSMNYAVPVRTFFLGNVPDLYSLWRAFNCRQLAHFCRILALLVFEPEDRQLLESPAVLKSLELLQLRRDRAARAGRDATVDMNQSILLGDKELMQRLLHLLQIMNYAPTLRRSTAYHVMAHFPFISETLVMLGLSEMDNWGDVSRLDALAKKLQSTSSDEDGPQNLSELGNVADMLENLAGSLQGNSLEPATQLGHIIHVINAAQQAGVVVGRRRRQRANDNGSSIHVSSVPLDSPSLDNLASAAMTLNHQVIMRRNGGSDDADDNWNANVEVEDGQSPDPSIHQPQYATTGRLSISVPEDAANELQFNALLLAPYQVEVLFVICTLLGGRRKIDAQRFLNDHGLLPTMDAMFHRLSFGAVHHAPASRSSSGSGAASVSNSEGSGDEEDQPAGIHGPGCECTPESALSVQYLRLLHNFCDRDCDNYAGRRLLLSDDERKYVFSGEVWEDGEKPSGLKEGLFSKIIGAFFREPDDSPYRFWLASCAESYLRGSSPHEQLFAAKSGLLRHLVKDIISDRLHCAGSLQTSFDLLGEACKGNSEVLNLLVSSLDEETFRKLMSAAAANLVDSNVFLRSLLLSVERISASRLFKSADTLKPADPWSDHEYGPWTGHSGSDTRFYLTHSWWDASILPTDPSRRKQLAQKSANEMAYDDARSSDWFPPGRVINQRTILGESIPSGETAPISSTVGYNGWLFSPPAIRLSLRQDPLAWALGEAAFQPNTIERLAWFLITNQSRLLRDLLCVVDLRNINHENICCLNTAVVVSMFASRREQLSGLLRELKRLNLEEQEAASRRLEARRDEETEGTLANSMKLLQVEDDAASPSLPGRGLQRLPSVVGDRTDVLRNFRELLWFWSEYYTHRGRDRLSLEFSSHLRFQEWYKVVLTLTEDDGSNTALVRRPVKLPKSPYQRSARIIDAPRRTG
jgi:hypothetical protein